MAARKFLVDILLPNGSVTASSFVKNGGLISQFLKADGSVDSSAYTTNLGTVTSVVAGTGLSGGTITGSGTISLASAYGDTTNPYASKTANTFLAAPNGAAGVPTFRAIVAADIPTLNQSTTGSAATLTTARTITIGSTGKTFNGSANVSWTLAEIGAYASSNPSGYISSYTETDTLATVTARGNTTTGDIIVNGDVTTKLVPSGYFSGTSNVKISQNVGGKADYVQFVILLHPVYNGTLIGFGECEGRFIRRRGSTSSGLSIGTYDVQSKTGYNVSAYGIKSSAGGNGLLCTCTYGGVKYVALKPDYVVQASEMSFDGYINGDANALLLVPYYNTNTATVLNTEVNSSIVDINSYTNNVFQGEIYSYANVTAPTFNGALSGNATTANSLKVSNQGATVDLNTAALGRIPNYGSPAYWTNAPAGVSYGTMYNLGGNDGSTVLGLQLVADVNHNVANSTKDLYFRTGNNLGLQNDWKTILHSGNYNGYSPTLTGTGASGTWGISISGSAALASSIVANPNRTDVAAYQVLWGNGSANSPAYSCAAVTIQSSTGTLQATTLRATADVIAYYSSDRRFKDNITPISNAIDKVKQIGGYEFDWNKVQETHTGHDIGVIAQEIEAVFPDIVANREDGYKSVKYERLIPVLIEAIKEQQLQIEELRTLIQK